MEADLKRILAYSTLSQLGYMVLAVGLGGPVAGMYHLTTHAFFKALLFLSAGSVIHGTHKQTIWELGGLWRSMRWTSLAFLLGALCLCGLPGLSGFFSKDAILVLAHEHNRFLYVVAVVTAGLTAFYITRAWVVAFLGRPAEHLHAHESPRVMLGPLAVLAGLSVAGGYLGIPAFLGEHHPFGFAQGGVLSAVEGRRSEFRWDVAGTSLAFVVVGIALAWAIYGRRWISASEIAQRCEPVYRLLAGRYYVDDLYQWYVDKIQQRILAGACALFERVIIIGLAVNGMAWFTQTAGRLLRRWQTGQVQGYVLAFFCGIGVLLYLAARP